LNLEEEERIFGLRLGRLNQLNGKSLWKSSLAGWSKGCNKEEQEGRRKLAVILRQPLGEPVRIEPQVARAHSTVILARLEDLAEALLVLRCSRFNCLVARNAA